MWRWWTVKEGERVNFNGAIRAYQNYDYLTTNMFYDDIKIE